MDFSGGSDNKESTCNAGDPGSIPGSGRSPGEGNGYRFHIENSMNRGTCHKELDTTEPLTLSYGYQIIY